MSGYTDKIKLSEHQLWLKTENRRVPYSFEIELTARCNFDCRHCYINQPAGHPSRQTELTPAEIGGIADQAVALGSLWVLLTGGEPLLRPDFPEIYRLLKQKGLLVSVFTNASLVNDEHIALFQKYPPRDVEVTFYGASRETFEKVTRTPGSYAAARQGLERLQRAGIGVRLKAMALRSNYHEMKALSCWCRSQSADRFRFDPMLHLRYDRDPGRNEEIKAERLSPEQVTALEKGDDERFQALSQNCDKLILPQAEEPADDHLFSCGAGNKSFVVGPDGKMRLCGSLVHPECVYDLRKGKVKEGWEIFFASVREKRSQGKEYRSKCQPCSIMNLCLWCPAHAWLETGRLDGWTEEFCGVAQARKKNLTDNVRE